jgi:hypothetical protein
VGGIFDRQAGEDCSSSIAMKPFIQFSPASKLSELLIPLLTLSCFALLPTAQAVNPAPDGGYPGGNTAEGQAALLSLTTGNYDTAVGLFSLTALTDGSFNTGVGAGALLANTADLNTATGAAALLSNTTGADNTANGAFALFSNTTGDSNTATGLQALLSNTTGIQNTATGTQALYFNIGSGNTANGFEALFSNTTGGGNTATGVGALPNNTTGSDNIALGFEAGTGVTTANHVICIGASGQNANDTCYIGQIFGGIVPGGATVIVDGNGHLGTIVSSQRFKEEIKPMEQASEALYALKPVTFHYKKGIDPQGIPQFGLVAEDVEAVNPDLAVRDKEGKVNTVRYEAVNAMLLNEFLKEHKAFLEEHRRVEKLEATVSRQQEQIEALAAGLEKVSSQIELSKAGARTIADN